MKYCWTTINVKDMEKSLKFYQEILGLHLDRKLKPNPEMEIAFLGEGETKVELIYHSHKTEVTYGTDLSLGFAADSIDSFSDFLKTKNIPIHSGPYQPNPFIKFIYIQDPDGLKIQIVENIRH